MTRKLPRGEETLPIAEEGGRMLTLRELRGKKLKLRRVSDNLLIERVMKRIQQGRVPTIYQLQRELSPSDQIKHMKRKDKIGAELLEVEFGLLQEEIRILGGE